MKKILFPTDFSKHAHHAFTYTLHLAEELGASVLLYHAFHYTNTGNFFVPAELIDQMNLEEKDKALQAFASYEQEVQRELGKQIPVSHMMTQGFAVDEIVEVAKYQEVDLIVMGTHGAGNLQDRLLGTVSAAVIEKASCPVLAIPESCEWKGIRHIVYATNFEEKELRLPSALSPLAQLFEARISCVHINHEDENGWDRLQRFFQEELFRIEIDPDQMELFMIGHTDIIEGLNAFIAENDVDVLSMLTHKRGWFQRLTQTSMTRKMSHNSVVPLLAFHA